MPNVQISELPTAILPLDPLLSFFEVQTVESGVTVSRKVTATDIALDLPDGTVVGSMMRLSAAPDTYVNTDQVVADGTNVILRDSFHASPNQPSLQTAIQGPFFAGRRAIVTTAELTVDGRLTMVDLTNGVQTFDIGHQNTILAGAVLLRNHIETGAISLRGSSSGGTFGDRTLFEGLPDGASSVFHGASNEAVAVTLTAAAGGLQANNALTGGGLERVLTIADQGLVEQLVDSTGVIRLKTFTGGLLDLRSDGDTDAEFRELRFTHQDGTSRGEIGFLGSTDYQMLGRIHGARLMLRAEDAGGFIREILIADPDADTELRGDQTLTLAVGDGGEIALLATANAATSVFHNAIETARTALLTGGGFEVNNTLTGAGFERALTVSDLGFVTGTVNEIVVAVGVVGIADDAVFPGTGAVTVPVGTTAQEPASENGRIRYDSTTSKMKVVEDEAWLDMITDALGELTDVTLTTPATGSVLFKSVGNWLDTTAVDIDPAAEVGLENNGTREFQTQDSNADHNTSGAQVLDHAQAFHDIGWNDMPIIEQDASVTLSELHVSAMLHRDATGDMLLTLPSGTSGAIPPVGSLINTANENVTGAMTIAAAGTLRFFDGSGTPATGTRTLAFGGIASMFHYSDTEWWIWGFGIT